eukprot:g732.t1
MLEWLKEKLPYWKALLNCWDDVTSTLTPQIVKEHCDPDAPDIKYANRILTSAQKELFAQLTTYISSWTQVVSEQTSARSTRSQFFLIFLDLIILQEELEDLWEGSDTSPLLENRPTMPKFTSVVWTIRSAKKFASFVDARSESKRLSPVDIEVTFMRDPWKILVHDYCNHFTRKLTQDAVEDKDEPVYFGNSLIEEFLYTLEVLNKGSERLRDSQWAQTRVARQFQSTPGGSYRKSLLLTRITHNYIVQLILNFTSCSHETRLISEQIKSPFSRPFNDQLEFNVAESEEQQSNKKSSLVSQSFMTSRAPRFSVNKNRGVASLARMLILAGRVKQAWVTLVNKSKSTEKDHVQETRTSTPLAVPSISSPLFHSVSNLSSSRGTTGILLKSPYLVKRFSKNNTTDLCSFIAQIEDLITSVISVNDISEKAKNDACTVEVDVWKAAIRKSALVPLSSCFTIVSQQFSREEIQSTVTSVAEFISFLSNILQCITHWSSSWELELKRLELEQRALFSLLEVLQVFTNGLANQVHVSRESGNCGLKGINFSSLHVQINALSVLLGMSPELTDVETSKDKPHSTGAILSTEKKLNDDFETRTGFTQTICFNPIYGDNTAASSFRSSPRRLQEETFTSSSLEATSSRQIDCDFIPEVLKNPVTLIKDSKRYIDDHEGSSDVKSNPMNSENQIQEDIAPPEDSKAQNELFSIEVDKKLSSPLLHTLRKCVFDVLCTLKGIMFQPSSIDDE